MSVYNAMRRRILAAVSLVAGGLLLLALTRCNTPFIPIPPPGNPTFTPVTISDPMGGSKIVWEARGGSHWSMRRAKVFVFNLDTETGVIAGAKADGSYVAGPFDGRITDRIELSYEDLYGEHSPVVCRRLVEGVAGTPCQ